MRPIRTWTETEVRMLRECTRLGFHAGQLAPILDRSKQSIVGKRRTMGFQLPPRPVDPVQPRDPSPIYAIQEAVARQFRVSVEDMLSARRSAYICLPRQLAYYLARDLTGHSLPSIGRRFGGRDHTTILHGIRLIEAKILSDGEFAETVRKIRRKINSVGDKPRGTSVSAHRVEA